MARDEFHKGFALGALLGGFAGAITALLLAPKRGEELRSEIAHHSERLYEDLANRTKGLFRSRAGSFQVVINEGRRKAEAVVDSAQAEAEKLIAEAEHLMREAKERVYRAEQQLRENIGTLKEAVQAAAETFQQEVQEDASSSSETENDQTQQSE